MPRIGHLSVLVMLILFLTVALGGPGRALATPTTVDHDSLLLTVNPDKSVEIGSNTTIFSPRLQNLSAFFPPGYAFQSSTVFSQQANAVVETTNAHYELPQTLNQKISFFISSISLTGSRTGLSSHGTLSITTTILPIHNVNILYSTRSNRVSANASAQVFFSPLYRGTPFENRTAFEQFWASNLGNQTWVNNMILRIESATHVLSVNVLSGTVDYQPYDTSANVSIVFIGIPSGSEPNFVSAYEDLLGLPTALKPQLNNVIQSVLSLSTGGSSSLTYAASTGTIDFTSTANYVSNLDSQLNSLKSQLFHAIFSIDPALEDSPTLSFLNSTQIRLSKASIQNELDLNEGTYSTTLSGLVINPQVGKDSTGSNFSMPGLFTTLSKLPLSKTGVNITLVGGSDSIRQVKVVVPSGTPLPNSTTSNSATWTNLKDISELQNVRFEVQALSAPVAPFVTSPTGIVVEAVIGGAILAGVVVYLRRQRAAEPPFASGPASSLGPSPAPPGQ